MALLVHTSTSVVEKAVEQKVLGTPRVLTRKGDCCRLTQSRSGRRLNLWIAASLSNDKSLVARAGSISPAALKTAKIALSVLLRIGSLTRDAVERAEPYSLTRRYAPHSHPNGLRIAVARSQVKPR